MRSLLLMLVACCLLLSGCAGGPKTYVFPPQAQIQQLEPGSDGQWRIAVRLHNFSTVAMRLSRVEGELSIDGIVAGRILLETPISVSASSVDVVAITLVASPEATAALEQALAGSGGIDYRLAGSITSAEPRGDYPFEFASRLDRVPGLDRVLR